MRNLNYELKQMCRRNRDGSFATQRDRERVLDLVANQLHELGYRHMAAASLKPKHIERLVQRWQAEGLAVGTIKNRMAELRWWTEKIGKQNVIARDNDHYGIGHRQYVTNVSKARQLTGWQAPAAGGPRARDLTPSEREADREARLTISAELGHEREQITVVYLGR